MWRNPKYFPAETVPERIPEPIAPSPPDPSSILATLDRGRGEQLRVTLAEYEGHPYVSLRVFAPGLDGQLWPVRGKGCSVRIRECRAVADALVDALERAGKDTQPMS